MPARVGAGRNRRGARTRRCARRGHAPRATRCCRRCLIKQKRRHCIYSCSLTRTIRLQPPSHTVAAPTTYGCSPNHVRLQALATLPDACPPGGLGLEVTYALRATRWSSSRARAGGCRARRTSTPRRTPGATSLVRHRRPFRFALVLLVLALAVLSPSPS